MKIQLPQKEPLPRVCRHMRTKTAFGANQEWKRGESTTASYWCLATLQPFGLDDQYCHPLECQKGRVCFEPCAEDED